MNCARQKDGGTGDLLGYAAGTLSAAEAAELERHMTECAACRELAEAQKRVWAALEEWTPEPVPADFDKKLYERIAAEGQRRWWHFVLRPEFSFSLRSAAPVAVACVALVAALVMRTPEARVQAPVPHAAAVTAAPAKIDADQVERSLDDIEMLKQLGFAADGSDSPS